MAPPRTARSAAEACREARDNRLRRAGWQRGEPVPESDDQSFSARQQPLSSPSTADHS